MTSCIARYVPFLLCALVACTQSTEPVPQPTAGAMRAQRMQLDAGWSSAGKGMNFRRSHHTITLLLDGRVLVAGGFARNKNNDVDSNPSAEVYNPITGEWTKSDMKQWRFGHTATLLPNGKVLVVGGFAFFPLNPVAEVFDPEKGSWEALPAQSGSPHPQIRGAHTATLLKDGQVLIVGGLRQSGKPLELESVPSAELYDSETGRWSEAGKPHGNRSFHTATLLSPSGKVLVVGGLAQTSGGDASLTVKAGLEGMEAALTMAHARILGTAEEFDPDTGKWTQLGFSLKRARSAHSATVLPDGKGGASLMIAGGWERAPMNAPIEVAAQDMSATGVEPLSSTELYDLSTLGATSPSMEERDMASARAFHTATLLPNDTLLVTGGNGPDQALASTELFDPILKQWSSGPLLPDGQVLHAATLLPGGRLLITGGYSASGEFLDSTSIYGPSNRWTPSVDGEQQFGHQLTATLLPTGEVLVAGGQYGQSAHGVSTRYNPDAGSWRPASSTGEMNVRRAGHSATLLANGQVLLAGGMADSGGMPLLNVELYDPALETWTRVSSMKGPRSDHTATLLSDGKVLVAGGKFTNNSLHKSCELYDPATQKWSEFFPPTDEWRSNHTATLLPSGKVLLAGGEKEWAGSPVKSTDSYDPLTGSWDTERSFMWVGRKSHTATLLLNGQVLVTGGYGYRDQDGRALDSAELYNPTNRSWELLERRMHHPRGEHTATLLPTGQVLVTGGVEKKGEAPLRSAELYDPVTKSWSEAEPLTSARAQHAVVLLTDGSLLAVGGRGSTGSLSTSERYTLSGVNGPRPALDPIGSSASLEPTQTLTLTGQGFRGGSEAGSGNSSSSAVDYPLFTLRSVETGQWHPLSTTAYSDTSATVTLPQLLPIGYYVLNVSTRGQTAGTLVRLQNTTAPDIQWLGKEPTCKRTREALAEFSFHSGAWDVDAFECRKGNGNFSACTSPYHWEDRGDGAHTFAVLARDKLGNRSTPITCSWTLDTHVPAATLQETPLPETRDTSASFSFTMAAEASDPSNSFECRLDKNGEGDFEPCTSPWTRDELSVGRHTFEVRTRDEVGNVSSPATHSWLVMHGYYGFGCAAGGASAWYGAPWALLLLRLRRRRRPH